MLKKIVFMAAMLLAAGAATAQQTYVPGHYRSDGTYVDGYYRSAPDAYRYNNNDSQSNGGTQRDEYSSPYGATNRNNANYGSYDNDGDGISNRNDSTPGY